MGNTAEQVIHHLLTDLVAVNPKIENLLLCLKTLDQKQGFNYDNKAKSLLRGICKLILNKPEQKNQ